MTSGLEYFVDRPTPWLAGGSECIVMSGRIRLARNIAGEKFPWKASRDERLGLWHRLEPVLSKLASLSGPMSFSMAGLDPIGQRILRERHLVSVEHGEDGEGSGVVLKKDEEVSIMVNEEDHLRIQVMMPGMDLAGVWGLIDEVDCEIEQRLEYAFSERIGYLTACPSNVGTGMRVSTMLHLPALSLLNEVEPIVKGLTRIGLAVRGLFGEGTEASGNMFQISNQVTLGEAEDSTIERLSRIVSEVAGHERNARKRLTERREIHLRDYVCRSFGILLNACLLTSREMMDLLSALHLGLDLGLVHDTTSAAIRELMLLTQPGHMQTILGKNLNAEERDLARAGLVRDRLKRVSVVR
jgi:protein arginine kinase